MDKFSRIEYEALRKGKITEGDFLVCACGKVEQHMQTADCKKKQERDNKK